MAEASVDFAAWERRMAFRSGNVTAEQLGISRQAVSELRKGRKRPSRQTQKLMALIEANSVGNGKAAEPVKHVEPAPEPVHVRAISQPAALELPEVAALFVQAYHNHPFIESGDHARARFAAEMQHGLATLFVAVNGRAAEGFAVVRTPEAPALAELAHLHAVTPPARAALVDAVKGWSLESGFDDLYHAAYGAKPEAKGLGEASQIGAVYRFKLRTDAEVRAD